MYVFQKLNPRLRAERHLWNRLKHSPRKAPKDYLGRLQKHSPRRALAPPPWRTDGYPTAHPRGPERHLWNRLKHSPRKAPKDSLHTTLAVTSPSWRTDGSPRKASKTFPSQGPSPTLLKDGRVPHGHPRGPNVTFETDSNIHLGRLQEIPFAGP